MSGTRRHLHVYLLNDDPLQPASQHGFERYLRSARYRLHHSNVGRPVRELLPKNKVKIAKPVGLKAKAKAYSVTGHAAFTFGGGTYCKGGTITFYGPTYELKAKKTNTGSDSLKWTDQCEDVGQKQGSSEPVLHGKHRLIGHKACGGSRKPFAQRPATVTRCWPFLAMNFHFARRTVRRYFCTGIIELSGVRHDATTF